MLGTAMMAGSSVWDLIKMIFQTGSSWSNSFFGLFDIFRFEEVPVGIILLCDMVVGVVYTYILWKIGRKTDNQNVFEKFSGVAIASTFWFYKQPHDNIILAVPCIAFLYLTYKGTDRKVYLYIFFIAAIVGSFYNTGILPASASRRTVPGCNGNINRADIAGSILDGCRDRSFYNAGEEKGI